MTSIISGQNTTAFRPVEPKTETKPRPQSMDKHIGESARRRKPNIFKLFYKFEQIPNVYQLSAGLPNEKLFPITGLEANAVSYDKLSKTKDLGHALHPKTSLIEETLQYGQAGGHPELAEWIQKYVDATFECPYAGGFGTMISLGTTDALNKVWQVFSNEWREDLPLESRDGLITEEFTYSLAAEVARVRGLNIVPVSLDSEGILPDSLEDMLANWDLSKGKRPHLLYTVSVGQNPTGATSDQERRRQIYKICQKYDIIIVEDEPYYFLQFDGVFEPCYLNIDVDGRVIRLDSYSKNFAPGSRLGYITAQPQIIKHLWNIAEEATQQPSGFTQMVVLETLKEWGIEGWNKWTGDLRDEYQERRDLMVDVLEKYRYVDDDLVLDFGKPAAGMFVWIKMQFQKHPLANHFTLQDMARAFWTFNATHDQPVLVTPGYFFAPSQLDVEHMAPYIRLSYAPSEKGNLHKESEAFGKNTHDFWRVTDIEEMKQLAANFPDV